MFGRKNTTGAETLDPGTKDILSSLLIFLLAVVLADVLLYQLVVVREGWQQTQRLSMLYARHYLTITNNTIRDTQHELDSLNRPEFLQRVVAGDWAGIQLLCQQTLADNPRLQHFALLPPNYSVLPETKDLPFSTQDMVNRVFAGNTAAPEISRVNGQRLLNLVRPVKQNGQTLAVLAASFLMPEFSGEFSTFAADDGYVVLKERVAGAEPVVALETGSKDWVSSTPIRLPTHSANLTLEFSPGPGLAPDKDFVRTFLLVLVGEMIVFIFVIGMMFKRYRAYLIADIHKVSLHVDAWLSGSEIKDQPPRLRIMQLLLEQIKGLFARPQIAARLRSSERKSGVGVVDVQDMVDNMAISDHDSQLLMQHPAPVRVSPETQPPTATRESPMFTPAKPTPTPAEPSTRASAAGSTGKMNDIAEIAIDASIFRAYDIRGIVDRQLNITVVRLIGQALGSEALDRGQTLIATGRDGRLSGPMLSEALIEGLRQSGIDVLDVGRVPTPVLYFATKTMGTESGVMLTGSHNPPDYNGLKMVVAGETLSGQAITDLYERIVSGRLRQGQGKLQKKNIVQAYLDAMTADVALAAPMKVVLDAGNGITGDIAPQLFQALGCEIIPLFCEVDGNFPNHHPDPSKPENLEDLRRAVETHQADLGLAFDGDGDRVGVITPAGKNIYADRLLMLFAKHVLISSPGADIIYDVKCTRDLRSLIAAHGGRPLMARTGHSFIKAKLRETGAALAGEMSGHIFFNDRWYGFDDGLYAGARLLEILSLEGADADAVFAEFPENVSTPELNIPVAEENKFLLIETIKTMAHFPDGQISTLDGLRVDFPQGWGLIRASNTTPVLVARFEGKTDADLQAVKSRFRELITNADASLQLPF